MEVIAESVRCHDEEHLKSLAIPFVNTPISNLHAFTFEFRPCRMDVAYQDCRAFLRAIAAVDREPDASAVTFHDDRGLGFRLTLHFDHCEMPGIPVRCRIQVGHRQRQYIVAIWKCFFEDGLHRHEFPSDSWVPQVSFVVDSSFTLPR